jgi:hypothetical protein
MQYSGDRLLINGKMRINDFGKQDLPFSPGGFSQAFFSGFFLSLVRAVNI